ncbi:hypothetical protein FSP39_022825 [Pinctada imbricata]|uniref:Uncharacterized protein n=1 Tax=Pinctada imbricata TaxID=66713 RepID=A0AA88YHS0_PINIB|nr:hypothetical protein FSP39_022825 [Pinctada imbricata]
MFRCCFCSDIDFLKILVEATDRGQSSQAANQNASGNAYIVEDYTEIAEMLPAPPPPPKPSTSFDESDCGYMEPRVTIKPQVARSKSCDGGTTDENAGYNSLTLRNNSTATLDQDQEYAMVIPKAERGKGKAGADGKSKVKSKLDTLKQIGGRISDMFAADKSSDSRTQVAFDSFRPVVEDNIYTIDADASPEEYSGRDIDEIPPLPQHYPTPIKDGHEYRVLEPQTGYTDCSENEVFSPDCKRKPFEYDVARNDNYSKARKMSNLTASGAFLLSISSDHYSDTSVV